MNIPAFVKLTRAIHGRHLVSLKDRAGVRTVEVYLIYENKQGDLMLHGWQRDGAFGRQPPPKWIQLRLEDVLSVEVSKERFDHPRPDYNPRSPGFHRVVYELDSHRPPPTNSSGGQAGHSRVHGPRRRSPPKGGLVARRNGGGTKRRQQSS